MSLSQGGKQVGIVVLCSFNKNFLFLMKIASSVNFFGGVENTSWDTNKAMKSDKGHETQSYEIQSNTGENWVVIIHVR